MDKPQLETLNRKAAETYDRPVTRSIATSYYVSLWAIALMSLILTLVSLAFKGVLAALPVAFLFPLFYFLMNMQKRKMNELLHMERKGRSDETFETMKNSVKSSIQTITWIFAFLILVAFLMFNFAMKIGF